MDFLGVGPSEILLVLVVALIIWGPRKLPEIARTLGKTVRALKKVSFDFTTALTKEIEKKDANQPASRPPESPGAKTQEPSSDADEARTHHKDDQAENLERHQQ